SPLNVNLVDLINELEAELSGSDSLAKITEAQRRANTLNEYGEQLVGHFVASAKEAGASWSAIGDAIGVSKQAAHQRWMTTYFDRYTKRARHIVTLAQERARDRRHGYIGTEHLLLGLLDEPAGLAAIALARPAGS